MKFLSVLAIVLLLSSNFKYGSAARILFLTPMGSRSHKIFYMGIAETLAKRGHQVTMVSNYGPDKNIDNMREVVIQNLTLDSFLENIFEDNNSFMTLLKAGPSLCLEGLRQPQIQALKNEKFDVVLISMFFNFCYLSLIDHFKVPYIYMFQGGISGKFNDIAKNFDFPSISGSKFMEPVKFPPTFTDRLTTVVVNEMFSVVSDFYLEPSFRSVCIESGLCPPDFPSISEFHKNASLSIINSVRTREYPPRPSMPHIIYAGGAHIKPAKKLPKDLEKWVEGSGEDGFIFFSLGSALNPDFLPEEYRQILIKVFGSLKQRVLWKWNQETMPDLPKNVKLQKWLPQPDLLGHPKIKLFITHGGLLSTLESSYNGVPVIGMPIFADQDFNMKEVQNEGWGRVMLWKKLEENVFRDIILEVLNNKKMAEIAKQKSVIMKDRLVPPDEEAAYWVEYVIRHKGAPHIRSPLGKMRLYEVYNIDVWAFIFFVITGVLYIFWLITKFIFRKCFGIGKQKSYKKKKE